MIYKEYEMINDLKTYTEEVRQRQNDNNSLKGRERILANDLLRTEFMNELIEYFGFEKMNEKTVKMMFEYAWDDAHSSGYYAVAQKFEDNMDLAARIIANEK